MRLKPVITVLIVSLAAACGKAPSAADGPQLTVLIGTDGYGDGSYNDTMLAGILEFCGEHPEVNLSLQQPESIQDAGARLDEWLKADNTRNRALILASNSYESILRGKPAPSNGRVLILETDEVFPGHSSYIIRRYGASWLCGAMSGFFAGIVVKAMDGNDMIDESALGFSEGHKAVSDNDLLTWTLADGPEGFSMRDSTYRFVYNNLNDYLYNRTTNSEILFFPLLGGSLPGLFAYSRYNGFVNVAGMDVDCSYYSKYVVPYSLCVNNDKVLKRYLDQWMDGQPWPEHTQFDLESDAVEVLVNKEFRPTHSSLDFSGLYKEYYSLAVEKEKAYEVE